MQSSKKRFQSYCWSISLAFLLVILAGCNALRPSVALPADQQTPMFIPPTLIAQASPTPTPDSSNPLDSQIPGCTNQLSVVQDLNFPDGTFVKPGASLDKQWKVKNSGTCNWNETYSIRLINGPDLGAKSPQAITPLRAGTEGTIRVVFTAPQKAGDYISSWQAFDSQGQAFGDSFWIEINVSGS